MFVDEVKISAKSGDGGNGLVAFRREKFVPRGGPAGGDGGRGGDVTLEADGRMTTLLDFRYKTNYKADRGINGGPNDMTGANATDLVLKVPVGTQIFDADTNELITDMVADGERFVIAKGGRGGRGNARFATPTRQTPRYAENGEPGQERHLRLELKLLADVGLIGFPNVGKSTLISQVSAAKPKIADYPFTTLVPNLGVVRVGDEGSFVMADIPGLIEGAHTGAGLGDRFLKHVERTRLLLHILDVSGFTERDPMEDFEKINRELRMYSPKLAELSQVVALNKIDVPGARETAESLVPEFESRGCKVYLISAATGEGVQPLIYRLAEKLEELDKAAPPPVETEEVVRITAERPDLRNYVVEKSDEHEFVLRGKSLERRVAMTDLENEDAVRRLLRSLRRIGVYDKLKALGAENGDTVKIGAAEFDYVSEDEVE
jgi:GTPase